MKEGRIMLPKTYEAILIENEKFLVGKGLVVRRIIDKKEIRSGKDRMVGMFVVSKKAINNSRNKNL